MNGLTPMPNLCATQTGCLAEHQCMPLWGTQGYARNARRVNHGMGNTSYYVRWGKALYRVGTKESPAPSDFDTNAESGHSPFLSAFGLPFRFPTTCSTSGLVTRLQGSTAGGAAMAKELNVVHNTKTGILMTIRSLLRRGMRSRFMVFSLRLLADPRSGCLPSQLFCRRRVA